MVAINGDKKKMHHHMLWSQFPGCVDSSEGVKGIPHKYSNNYVDCSSIGKVTST